VRRFFSDTTPSRTAYLAQLLNATFTFFALTVDEIASQYLRSKLKPLSIFLDTNFIFGLLNLHVNPLEDVSAELISLIREHNLPFKLYYHTETLAEIRRTLDATHDFMRQFRYSQAVSRAAVSTGRVSGVELRYHEVNCKSPASVDDFFAKYSHVPELLKSLGCVVFRPNTRETPTVDQKGPLIAEYDDFVKKVRPGRPKAYPALDHDIVVWWTINVRRAAASGTMLDAGALFLTADYLFYRFDWQRLRKPGTLGAAVLPSQLLQFVRPFVPRGDELDKRLVEALSLPEFRAASGDLNRVASRVLGVMATYAELPEETAATILSDELLLRRLRPSADSPEKLQYAVENEITKQNAEARKQIAELQEELTQQQGRVQDILTDADKRVAARVEDAVSAARSERLAMESAHAQQLAQESAARHQLESRLAALEAREAVDRKRRQLHRRVAGLLLIALLAGLTTASFLRMPAFASHPHRSVLLGLSDSFWAVLGVALLTKRWVITGTLLTSIVLAVVTLIYY
jgi:hypothetical protein